MTPAKKITVLGATGAQGNSVMKSLLANARQQFQVRGTTRDTESERAKALTALGGDMVELHGLKHQALVDVMEGSWGVFLNTHPLMASGDAKEPEIGRIIVDAASAAGVRTIVYSALPSVSDATKGAIKNSDFDDKAWIANYIKTKGFEHVILVSPGWYMSSFFGGELVGPEEDGGQFGGFPIKEDAEHFLSLKFPPMANGAVPLIDVSRDYGDIVHGAFLAPEQYSGRFIQAYSQATTMKDLVDAFHQVTGSKTRYIATDWKSIETYGDDMLEIVKSMVGYIDTTGGLYYAEKNDDESAKDLKAIAAEAKGLKGSDSQLITIEAYITASFSSGKK